MPDSYRPTLLTNDFPSLAAVGGQRREKEALRTMLVAVRHESTETSSVGYILCRGKKFGQFVTGKVALSNWQNQTR